MDWCAGALPSSFTAGVPDAAASLPAPPQKGVFGGHDAVDALFGRARSSSDADGPDHMDCHTDCGMAIDEAAGADAAVPLGWPSAGCASEDGVVPEVQAEVERLLSGSLDSVLFAEDDSLFAARCEQSFALPAVLSGSHSSSCRSDDVSDDGADDVSSRRAAVRGSKDVQLSPTSHLPEQHFCSPLVQDVPAHGSFAYLHAEIYAAMHVHATALDDAGGLCWGGAPFQGPSEAVDMACQEHVLQRSLMELGAWDESHHDTHMRQVGNISSNIFPSNWFLVPIFAIPLVLQHGIPAWQHT